MVVDYRQSDGSVKVYGYMMSDGPLSAAQGQMLQGAHSKCWHVARKRAAKGDAVTGRVLTGSPTAYDIEQLVLDRDDLAALGITAAQAAERGTPYLSERLTRLRAIAASIGKGVGDPTVVEAFTADQHGGPYAHQHSHRLEVYQLIAHLQFAHGLSDTGSQGVQDLHARLHAQAALDGIRADRINDHEQEPRVTDWRTQYTVDIN